MDTRYVDQKRYTDKEYNALYYDIESLPDIFTLCDYHEPTDTMNVYYLFDATDPRDAHFGLDIQNRITQAIYDANKGFTGPVYYYDLTCKKSNIRLAKTYGCDPGSSVKDTPWRYPLTPDTSPDYDPNRHPFIMGYNSFNYDTTELAIYLSELMTAGPSGFAPPSAALMRQYNDELFTSRFKPSMPDRLRYAVTGLKRSDLQPWQIARGKEVRDGQYIELGGTILKNEGWNPKNPAYHIRQAMINSGRHIDVARLNEKQSRVALKRLLGMLGCQILEPEEDLSDRKKREMTRTIEGICNLIAYNASDVLNLRTLFHHNVYASAFELKKQMLVDYPDLIYKQKTVYGPGVIKTWDPVQRKMVEQKSDKVKTELYEPGISPDNVRPRRHTINSSSAQLAACCLAPYSNLTDDPCVSFMYPSAKKAKERGIPQRNILEDTENFINDRLVPIANGPEGKAIITKLRSVINMYRQIEGKDFNGSHDEDGAEIYSLDELAGRVNVPYMGPDGKASDCYVTFSVGGIHGAQYNKALYDADVAAFEEEMALFNKVLRFFRTPLNFLTDINAKGKPCRRKTVIIDNVEYPANMFLAGSSTLKSAQWKKKYLDAEPPQLFQKDAKGNEKLNKKYSITSFGPMNHEDFTSYYPIMLVNMSAFENPGLGYDRYFEIFGNKQKFGKLMKDKSIDKGQREIYANMREGTKLILNSASGAADTVYNSSIRMNNRITAMRIIGQMFTWRIGQAQSLEGAKVTSTNTDGLYTEMEPERNAEILAREAAAIGVDIEPEPLFLVSKDANNRFEAKIVGHTGNAQADIDITSASGGSLACKDGPDPRKALAHPAILDWALCEFLKYKALKGAMDDFEPEAGRFLLTDYADYTFPDRAKKLQMFQNIVAASLSTGAYPFASAKPVTAENELSVQPIKLQHYTRVFYVDIAKVPPEHRKDIVYLCTAYVRPKKANENADRSPLATKVIGGLMGDEEALLRGVPSLKKVNGIEFSTPCIIANKALHLADNIEPEWLDRDYYNILLRDTYTKNWRNTMPGEDCDEAEDDESDDGND